MYGIFPILWVAINAIWLHKVTELRGHSAALRTAFTRVSDDRRVQAILVAFCFGAALEGLAGGGAPVAICAVILMALGLSPIKAAAACLIADTSPVAFGALGQPIDVLATQTGLPVHDLAVMIGRQTPLLRCSSRWSSCSWSTGRPGSGNGGAWPSRPASRSPRSSALPRCS